MNVIISASDDFACLGAGFGTHAEPKLKLVTARLPAFETSQDAHMLDMASERRTGWGGGAIPILNCIVLLFYCLEN